MRLLLNVSWVNVLWLPLAGRWLAPGSPFAR